MPSTPQFPLSARETRPIRRLDSSVIHRIAAGEVVDRPASALKELVENALDAGASKIRVTITDGGLKSLVVEDDGVGFSRADLETCLERHATSKISSLEDLDHILSLGFRGEALSAISSVAKVRIETARTTASVREAWVLEAVGGSKMPLKPSARQLGTKLTVDELFFNIPARRKFLKKPSSEAAECVSVLNRLAMAHPETSWEWYVIDADGEVRDQSKFAPTTPTERFLAVEELSAPASDVIALAVDDPEPGIRRAEVLALRPPHAARSGNKIHLVVNGRVVFDKRLPYALREAYSGLIEIGHFPIVLVRLDVDPSLIDVNIHPQKKELRWPEGFSLGGLVYRMLRPHFQIQQRTPEPVQDSSAGLFSQSNDQIPEWRTGAPTFVSNSIPATSTPGDVPTPGFTNAPSVVTSSASVASVHAQTGSRPPFRFAELRVVGEVGASWIVCESPHGLVILDQHAAHERIEFENFLKRDLLRPTPLLVPLEIAVPLTLQDNVAALGDALLSMGFDVDTDSSTKDRLVLSAVPQADRRLDWGDIFEDLFSALERGDTSQGLLEGLRTQIASSLACHGSVRRGQRIGLDQIRSLLQQLDQVAWGAFCPHGRPVWFLMSHTDIENAFHR